MLLLLGACGAIVSGNAVNPYNNTTHPTSTIQPSNIPADFVVGNTQTGKAIFLGEKKIEGMLPCVVCHYVDNDQRVLVGPDLSGLGDRAGSRVAGQSAVEYLYASIRAPDAYVVEGFPAGTMNKKYDQNLTQQDVEDLVAYLLTL
jgi:cytochrome c